METIEQTVAAAEVLAEWEKWLFRGWHGVRAVDWFDNYMLPKFESDMAFLDNLVDTPLKRAVQRERRNAVERLLRFQHMLPWDSSRRPQFFTEFRDDGEPLSDKEHALPISQLKSLILMAWGDKDFADSADAGSAATSSAIAIKVNSVRAHLNQEAERRLLFAWICPTVRCTKKTHQQLSRGEKRRCNDFSRPLSRYEGVTLLRFDGEKINPTTYSLDDMLIDLRRIPPLRPVVDRLKDLTLPDAAEEEQYTKTVTRETQ